MFEKVLERAERKANEGDINGMYSVLRELPLADFCSLHLERPTSFPSLASLIPKMPSDSNQKKWVGDFGVSLMRRTSSLVRLYEYLSWRHTGSSLVSKNILDYGCGWGRVLRTLPYFCDPSSIEGVDPLQDSLEICRENGIHSTVHLIDPYPKPFESKLYGEFDFVTIFSVFTHTPDWLSSEILKQCADATSENGIVVCTIRSVDWINVRDGVWPADLINNAKRAYSENGYAFIPVGGETEVLENQIYGDTILTPLYFKELCARAGWHVVSFDRDMLEPYQLCAILAKRL